MGSNKARAEERAKRIEDEKINPPPKKPLRPKPKDPKEVIVIPYTKAKPPKAPPIPAATKPKGDDDVVMSDPAPAAPAKGGAGSYSTSATYLNVPVLIGVAPESLKDYDPSNDIVTLKKALKGNGTQATEISAIISVLTTKVTSC